MRENLEQKEISKEPKKEQEKPEEKQPPKEDLGKTEMCQLIYYDFTVK